VLDVFPPNYSRPIRIEFSEDQISSIRTFGLEDQRSRDHLDFCEFAPANEILIDDIDRKQAAQRLHEYLITLDLVPSHDKDGFRGAFLSNSRPPGWDLLAPILRTKNSLGFNL